MEPQDVRTSAQAHLDALIAGDMDRAIEDFSTALHSNLGQVMSLLPLPLTAADIELVERSGAGFNAIFRLVGETEEVRLQTRWKDHDGKPTIVECSHVSEPVAVPMAEGEDGSDEGTGEGA